MSMWRCDHCDRPFDTDLDPDCFLDSETVCFQCRKGDEEKAEDQEAEERRQWEEQQMEEHFRKHPHG